MPAAKLQRTINSVNEHLLSLRNAECARGTSLGTDWQKIRIGLRCGFYAPDGHSDITTDYYLWIGLLSDKTKGIGDLPNCPHFLGIQTQHTNSNSWTYLSGENSYIGQNHTGSFEVGMFRGRLVENGSITQTQSATDRYSGISDHRNKFRIGALPEEFLAVWFDFERSGQDIIITGRWYDETNSNVSHSSFEDTMLESSPGDKSNTMTMAGVDEATHGDLTVPTVFWENQTSHWFEIADFYTAKLA